VLVFENGETIPVDIDLVIGRQPDRDDAVRASAIDALRRPLPYDTHDHPGG